MSALQAFHFLRPWWLLALLLLPLLPLLLHRGSSDGALRRLVDARVLPFLVEAGGRRSSGLVVGTLLGWTLACLALAGPTWQRLPQAVYASRSAQIIAVSMSRRMLARDLSPDRLVRVRYKIHALLQANKAGQNGLVAYAGQAFTVAPLTTDANALSELVDALAPDTMPVQGDNVAAAIRRATRLIEGAGFHHGSIVVIDDHADQDALAAARAANRAGMRVSVLGVGTREGAPVPAAQGGFEQERDGHALMARRDDASLRALAQAGGGRYVVMTGSKADVAALAAQLPRNGGVRDSRHKTIEWRDNGAWLLLPLLLLLMLGFRRGVLLCLPLLLLPLWVPPAHASGWQDAWLTRDQRAARALAEGHPKLAMRLARDPALRGTAAYRAGDYHAAARAFAKAPGAWNMYNRGNALARMHRYREALKAYDQALATAPGLADARANRKAVLDWLRKHRHRKQDGGQGVQGGQSGQGSGARGDEKRDSSRSSGGQGTNSSGNSTSGEHKSPGKDRASRGQAQRPGKRNQSGRRPQQSAGNGRKSDQGVTTQTPAEEQARKRAQRALRKKLNAQLGQPQGQRPYALGRHGESGSGQGKRLPQAMLEALQRVPDDPGGLLRNKFMLEYQRRLQRGSTDGRPAADGGD